MRKPLLAELPEGVFRIRKKSGKTYWYYQRRRGKPDHGPNIPLPEYGTPEFWHKLAEISGQPLGADAKTVDALIAEYKASPKFMKRAANTKATYGHALNGISDRWGTLRVDGLTPAAIQKFIDEEFVDRESMGNLTLSVIRIILKFGVPRGYINSNPAREVEGLEEDGESAFPWPEWIWEKVVAEAPPAVARLAVLGRATGQRISDLIGMLPRYRDGDGLYTTIRKLRTIEPTHWCPLAPNYAAIIDGWGVFPHTTYIADEQGGQLSERQLRRRLYDYVASVPEIAEAGVSIKPHGLRALAVCDRRIAGQPHQRIANDIGMSIRQVFHYSRHIDQRLAAGGGEREQNEAVKTPDAAVKTQTPK